MPILAQDHLDIPTKDILSWCEDDRSAFDQDKPIYIDCAKPQRTISANQAYVLIRKLVAGFRNAGLQKGDCVCIHAFNNLHYPILVQSIIGAGGTFLRTNPGYTSYELNHALKTAKAKFIVAEKELLPAMKTPAAELGIPASRIWLFGSQNGQSAPKHHTWRTLLEHGEEGWVRFDDLETAKNTTAFLMFSSGTTGLPKAAQLSHYNIIAQHTLVHGNPAHPETYPVSRICCLPLFHAAAAPYTHTTTLRAGYPSYIMRRFDLRLYLTYFERYAITSAMLVPPMVVAIVNLGKSEPDLVRRSLKTLRHGVAGAAPLDAETQRSLQSLLAPDAAFTQTWAMTETSCLASYFYHPGRNTMGSVGRFMPGLDVKLVDDEDVEIDPPFDRRGELCIRGPTVIRGYLDNPEANARDWDQDGFFHTGDILYCDSQTQLWYVVDRKKELIKVRELPVAPAEIEGVLLAHPGIVDAAVIGTPAREGGEETPMAYVVKRGGTDVSEAEVQGWVSERLARYKGLEGGVKFVEAIPKTASGKILKRVLREEAKRERGSKL
ncbi:hypothetical protein LTR53_013338 [Teratosphaeriaceae sp. CCFEE 6253]|nr:hypothetical protein LTR53_013338 [Teratosphaeriaceae sp. CCFEE 6253]